VGAPEGFGYKIAWLAIRTESTQATADALGMPGMRAASWAEGVEAAYGARQEPQAVVFRTRIDLPPSGLLGILDERGEPNASQARSTRYAPKAATERS